MNEPKKVIIVDDHKIVRDGIRAMLIGNKSYSIIADLESGEELIEKMKVQKPDIVILDLGLPKMDGVEATKILNEKHPSVNILILTADATEENIVSCIKAGAKGFLSKESSREEFLKALNYIAAGENYYGASISEVIFKSYSSIVKGTYKNKQGELLSERELEIIKAFSEGFSFKEIADKLNISARTVESHKNNILQKLELKNTIEMVKYAIKNNIVKL